MNDDLLRRHAREWIEAHGDPWADDRDGDLATSRNPWLPIAERAFCLELMAWRERNALPHARRWWADAPGPGFHLYRLWDEDDRLLYVGVSVSLRNRLRTHNRRWPGLVHHATWEKHPDAASMLRAEREAIQTEYPALNVEHV